MIKIVFFLGLLTSCVGLVEESFEEIDEMISETQDTMVLDYLALGDSYTIGESVGENDRFPYQLIHSTFNDAHKIGKYQIIARTGWTTRNLLDAMDKEVSQSDQFSFVTLLIGVNNQYQGKPFSQYESELNELIDLATVHVGGDASRVVLVSIPDYSVTPFASSGDQEKIAREIGQYNDYKKSQAEQKGARFVYITDLTQSAQEDLTLLADDGLHPSAKNYGQWVERISVEIQKIIDGL